MAPNRYWIPSYDQGVGQLAVLIPDRKLAQCPTGYITAEETAWLDQYSRAKMLTKATRSPYFASLSDADPQTLSAFELIERENAMIDAEIREETMRRR